MPYAYHSFRFRFLNENGKNTTRLPLAGSADLDEVNLEGNSLNFSDIHAILRHENRLVFVLKPFIAVGKGITENILPNSTLLPISLVEGEEMAFTIKSTIEQHLANEKIRLAKQKLNIESFMGEFRHVRCPICEVMLDLTPYRDTPLIYCEYCDNIFDKHNNILAGTDRFGICPECHYYNHLGSHLETHFYAYRKERAARSESHYQCDSCTSRKADETMWKNSLYLVGLPSSLFNRFKASSNQNPAYPELTQAIRLAQEGKFESQHSRYGSKVGSNELFHIMTLRNDGHPGVHYNFALSLMAQDNHEEAARQFQKSLNACSNFKPTLDLLAKNKNLQ